jgi:hypothetical protein
MFKVCAPVVRTVCFLNNQEGNLDGSSPDDLAAYWLSGVLKDASAKAQGKRQYNNWRFPRSLAYKLQPSCMHQSTEFCRQ